MCVIIIKRKGVEMPSEAELRAAHRCNPDGCGFVSSNGLYWRGLDFDEFLQRLAGVGHDDACVIHFRLATHGSVKESNCHPFKSGDVYFAHNGILPVRPSGDMTDSETAFTRIIMPRVRESGFWSREAMTVAKEVAGGSRFAFMYEGDIVTIGDYIEDERGVLWSNMRHLSCPGWWGLYHRSGGLRRYGLASVSG